MTQPSDPRAGSADFDVLVVGGGMVGAGLAAAVAGSGLRIGVAEAHPFGSRAQPSYDDRAIALAQGSRGILEAMGVWEALAPEAEPILRIHVSDRGHFGFARLDHRAEGVDALGYVTTGRSLGRAILPAVEAASDCRMLCPARVEGLRVEADAVRVTLLREGERSEMSARLLVAADGGQSRVREQLGIGVREWTYGHHAVIANLTAQADHRGTAYERFTDTGPLAMLPLTQGRCALVWTVRDEEVEEIMGLEDSRFLQRLQARFGYRLGRLERVGRRSAYPLRLIEAREHVRPRVALLGNAAHTVHPVAGQGLNLSIRDVAVLADLLAEAASHGGDPGSADLLQRYAAWRRADQRTVLMATDLLVRLFANPLPPLRLLRNLGMLGVDLAPGVKHLLARQAMGLRGRMPRLSRGLRLG
ncbi:MAG: 2-octaprenyl-6-methoxyphenyl hydroxylase [Chromatiales bacterium]|jgi:2-octaprenyl-6-methoxyphenol hydroxylase